MNTKGCDVNPLSVLGVAADFDCRKRLGRKEMTLTIRCLSGNGVVGGVEGQFQLLALEAQKDTATWMVNTRS